MTLIPDPKVKSLIPIAGHFDDTVFLVGSDDGPKLGVPITWLPYLRSVSAQQRIARDLSTSGLHWIEIYDDSSIEGLLAGGRAILRLERSAA